MAGSATPDGLRGFDAGRGAVEQHAGKSMKPLTKQIPASVAAIYRYWLSATARAVHEQKLARRCSAPNPRSAATTRVPCGSGKKFKKCCGDASLKLISFNTPHPTARYR